MTLPPLRFVLHGEVLEPRAGVIALDVGNKCVPGVIDHHYDVGSTDCAATLLLKNEEFLTEHIGSIDALDAIVLHAEPDLDCVVSAYLVHRRLVDGRFPPGGRLLAQYARQHDAGLPHRSQPLHTSLWALYAAAIEICERDLAHREVTDGARYRAWIERGFALVDAALQHAPTTVDEIHVDVGDARFDAERLLVEEQWLHFHRDLDRARKIEIELPKIRGGEQAARGLIIESPRSALFKHFARTGGYIYTHVIIPANDPDRRSGTARHVISVPPERGVWLKGLGAMLEAREVLRRTERGELRGGEPRWADVTNDDPWYDGRSPLHGFTIVDSPRRGTVIDVAEVIDLALHTDAWIPLGRQTRHRFCPACHAIGRPSDRFCVKDRNQLVPAMIGGRFEIMGLIDQGGMGVVYHVRDVTISREYALKVIRQDRAPDARTHRRFLRETRLANAMDHPNLMSIVHIDADPTVGVYMVSEYIEGITLAEDIHWCFERIGEYPPGRLRSVASQICQGLEAMHSAGVVHRDLKPGNIMLAGIKGQKVSPDPRVKLLDFGLAILETPSATTITEAGKIMGTPGFLSPEQGLRKRAARRSDIYALGSILYQMLTGSRPYQPLRGLEAVIAQREGPPPPVRKAAPGAAVGKKLDTYVMKMLHPDPRKRPPSVRDVRETLDRLTVDL